MSYGHILEHEGIAMLAMYPIMECRGPALEDAAPTFLKAFPREIHDDAGPPQW